MDEPDEESNFKSNIKNDHEDPQKNDAKQIEINRKQKTVNRKQRQRLGLLSAGTQLVAKEEILFYISVLNLFSCIFFHRCLLK